MNCLQESHHPVGMCGAMKSNDDELQMGIARALWSIYQYALPQVPGVMSARIYEYLNENGYLRGNGNVDI